ncbi:MAG: glycosyltransferase family 39 protein [Saprospiraceae bacterium]|nr:glycosyltransferase family 39 protein [Saprospiraceae bacterium]
MAPFSMQHRRIQLLILVFFLFGLQNIQQPPLDKHDWRQTLTLSISENFLEHPNPFYPRTDIGGETEGIMAAEFPAFNYLLAMLFKVFGVHYWLGRLLNWAIACAGLWFYYQLTSKVLNQRAGYFAMLAMMGSIVFEYARKSMPDTFALSASLMGVYLLWQFLERGQFRYLASGLVLFTIGMLSKIPFVMPIVFLILPLLDAEIPAIRKKQLMAGLLPCAGMVGFWYGFWMPYLLEHYKNQLIWPVSILEGWKIVVEAHGNESWLMLSGAPFHFKIPFLFAVMGLGQVLTGNSQALKYMAGTYILLFFAFILKTGIVFPTHDYYIIPALPLLALLVGHFLDKMSWHPAISQAIAILILIAGILASHYKSATSRQNRPYLMELPAIMDQFTAKDARIMVNNGAFNPTMMFWAHRKGWTVNQDVPFKSNWMPDFRRDGLQYILMDRHLNEEGLPYPLIFENEHFRLYSLVDRPME